MGQYLERLQKDAAGELKKAEDGLAALTKSKEWQAGKTAADLAGIADPTPTSDLISLAMSVAEGDWVGAALSGVAVVPYIGDALAKPAKLVRAAKAVKAIEAEAAALMKTVAHMKSEAFRIAQRKVAAQLERARRSKEAAEKWAKSLTCVSCAKPANKFGTQLPTTGRWVDPKTGKAAEPGNGRWISEEGNVSLEYKQGYPDFSTSRPASLYEKGGGAVEIEMKGDKSDFITARNAMREKLGDPKWPGSRETQPPGYTWHHTEDGATMQLVRSDVHAKADSGAAHIGGESIVAGKDNYRQDSQF
jgi:A nuclease of the HNH/ENDO VII superfamily with conserved WHH